MIKRAIQEKIEKILDSSPVTFIIGARQIGKTTLIKEIGKERGSSYLTFDDLRSLSGAQTDPMGFIANIQKPVILDEAQRVPELFLPIKLDVDNNRIPGRYALTGSANPLFIPQISDALVGRVIFVHMYPLSQGEIAGKFETFVDTVFGGFNKLPTHLPLNREEFCKKLVIGGFPAVQTMDDERRTEWFMSYETSAINRDIQALAQIDGASYFPRLLHLLAARVATLMNVAEISRSSTVPKTTLHRYLGLLKTLFLFDTVPAWLNNLGKRYNNSPKLIIPDSGLLCFLLGINSEKLMNDTELFGRILESFVISEVKKQLTWNKTQATCFHYHIDSGPSVDLVLEDASGNIVGIEVKSTETITAGDFKGLKDLQDSAGKKWLRGIVLYMGDAVVPFGKDMYALPISALWEL